MKGPRSKERGQLEMRKWSISSLIYLSSIVIGSMGDYTSTSRLEVPISQNSSVFIHTYNDGNHGDLVSDYQYNR